MTPGSGRVHKIDAAFLAGLAAVGVGVLVLSGRPVVESKRHAASLTDELAVVYAEQDTAQQRAVALVNRVARLHAAIDASAVPLRSADEINEQVASLTNAASSSGLRLSEVRPGRSRDAADQTEQRIDMLGSGPFSGLVALLDELGDQFPDIRVRSLAITRQGTAKQSAGLGPETVRFAVEMVWFADPAER